MTILRKAETRTFTRGKETITNSQIKHSLQYPKHLELYISILTNWEGNKGRYQNIHTWKSTTTYTFIILYSFNTFYFDYYCIKGLYESIHTRKATIMNSFKNKHSHEYPKQHEPYILISTDWEGNKGHYQNIHTRKSTPIYIFVILNSMNTSFVEYISMRKGREAYSRAFILGKR